MNCVDKLEENEANSEGREGVSVDSIISLLFSLHELVI